MTLPTQKGEKGASPGGSKFRTIRVVTRCTTKDEFLAAFARFIDGDHLFVVTRKPLPVGPRRRFLIQLKGGRTMLGGQAEVVASITDGTGVGGRNGMRIKMADMDAESNKVHTALLEAARFADGSAPEVNVSKKSSPPNFPATPSGNGASAALSAPAAVTPVAPQQPERAPSSSYTLPANPFGGLDHAALEQFVECTLYEEAGNTEAEDDGWSEPPQPSAAAGLRPPTSPGPLPQPRGKGPRTKRGSEVGYSTEEETAWYGEDPKPTAPEPFEAEKPKLSKRMMMIIGGAVAGATIFGLLIGYLVGASDEDPAEVAQNAAVAEVTAADVAPDKTVAKDDVDDADEVAAEAVIEKPAVETTPPPTEKSAMNSCTANITTVPRGVDVTWAGEALGKTPLSGVEVPCGDVSVAFSHARYRNAKVKSSADPGVPVKLSHTMQRMQAQLVLRSVPAGAVFKVKGRRVGKRAKVSRYTRVVVEATLKGHKKWRKKIFVKGNKQVVRARLKRGKRSFRLPLKKRRRR